MVLLHVELDPFSDRLLGDLADVLESKLHIIRNFNFQVSQSIMDFFIFLMTSGLFKFCFDWHIEFVAHLIVGNGSWQGLLCCLEDLWMAVPDVSLELGRLVAGEVAQAASDGRNFVHVAEVIVTVAKFLFN